MRPVVLLVSSDDDLRAAAVRGLADSGYDVVDAAHAGHALLACLAGHHIDVLVTELSMPDVSGPMLADRIRRFMPSLPVLYLGARGARDAADVLARPFTLDDLVERLASALTGATA